MPRFLSIIFFQIYLLIDKMFPHPNQQSYQQGTHYQPQQQTLPPQQQVYTNQPSGYPVSQYQQPVQAPLQQPYQPLAQPYQSSQSQIRQPSNAPNHTSRNLLNPESSYRSIADIPMKLHPKYHFILDGYIDPRDKFTKMVFPEANHLVINFFVMFVIL